MTDEFGGTRNGIRTDAEVKFENLSEIVVQSMVSAQLQSFQEYVLTGNREEHALNGIATSVVRTQDPMDTIRLYSDVLFYIDRHNKANGVESSYFANEYNIPQGANPSLYTKALIFVSNTKNGTIIMGAGKFARDFVMRPNRIGFSVEVNSADVANQLVEAISEDPRKTLDMVFHKIFPVLPLSVSTEQRILKNPFGNFEHQSVGLRKVAISDSRN